jgi:hypothetical protein
VVQQAAANIRRGVQRAFQKRIELDVVSGVLWADTNAEALAALVAAVM